MKEATTGLQLHVIYDRPSDYPQHFVMRTWNVIPDARAQIPGDCELADTLEEARKLVPSGRVNIGRFPWDDPAIVEVWG